MLLAQLCDRAWTQSTPLLSALLTQPCRSLDLQSIGGVRAHVARGAEGVGVAGVGVKGGELAGGLNCLFSDAFWTKELPDTLRGIMAVGGG